MPVLARLNERNCKRNDKDTTDETDEEDSEGCDHGHGTCRASRLSVVDAHAGRVVSVESAAGEDLGREANVHRKRHQPGAADTAVEEPADATSLVEIAHKKYYGEDEQ